MECLLILVVSLIKKFLIFFFDFLIKWEVEVSLIKKSAVAKSKNGYQ